MRHRPISAPVRAGLRLLAAAAMAGSPLAAQQQAAAPAAGERVKLSAVLTAFLVDSGVRTRGLPWTTGNTLPVRWATPAPVANPDAYARQQGITLVREGTFLGTLGDSVALRMSISVKGTEAGVSGVSVLMDSMWVTRPDGGGYLVYREMIEEALKNDGVTFQPLKCQREVEGASYGNLVDAFKVPGKTASGLWWFWQSPQQELNVVLTILYRRTDLEQVECYSR